MIDTMSECITGYTDTEHASSTAAYFVSGLAILIIFLNLISNISVIFSLFSTNQLNNPSMRLIFYLSIADICMALLGQTTFVTVIINNEKVSCRFKALSEFFGQLFAHSSAYIIGLIGYDRYFRMKYLNRYSEYVSTCKLNVGLLAGISIAFVQSLLLTLGSHYNTYARMSIFYHSIDLVMLVAILMPHILAVIVIRNHRKLAHNRELLKQVDTIITTTATRIMIAIVIFYTPYVLFTLPRIILAADSPIRKELWFNTYAIVSIVFAHSNSFVNALIFLSYNAKCREKVLSMIKKVFTCCSVQDNEIERQVNSADTELF